MIIFENDGNIDIRAIKTFGVNSKAEGKSAIGYFGTGLKYAIAVLLRNGHSISIVTGNTQYDFGIRSSKIRNDEFDIVTMNGEELGFTTSLGKNWEMWMAFREIYSNMLDENGHAYVAELYEPKDDTTYVLVKGAEIEQLYLNKDKYFLNHEVHKPIHEHGEVDAYQSVVPGQEMGYIFYKGVRVMETRLVSLFDYNHKMGLTLTEDRTIRDTWSTLWHVSTLVKESKDKDFIKLMVMAADVTYESRVNYKMGGGTAGSEFFLDVVGDLRKKYKDVGINPTAVDLHKQLRSVSTVMPGISCYLNNIEQAQLDKAVAFCKESLELELDDYRLIVCKDLGNSNQLGRADIEEGIMYISKQCFREGTKRVATAILEEYTHCKFEVEDETVAQKWVYLNQILSLGERLKGEPL